MAEDAEYGTYDRAEIHPAPDLAVEEGAEPAGAPEEVLPEFDQRYAEPLDGLMFLGALTKKFTWLGHTFVIRTLGTDEILAVAQVIKDWDNTAGSQKAYTTAMVAMCTISVDGVPLPIPVEERNEHGGYDWAFHRFDWVKARWFGYTLDAVYNEYKALEDTAFKVVEAMGKVSG